MSKYCGICQEDVELPCSGESLFEGGFRDASACEHLLALLRGPHGRPMVNILETSPRTGGIPKQVQEEIRENELRHFAPNFPMDLAQAS